ncbi:MAG TPA: hypothetical protein VNE16_06205 [Vicinamibacterales bacterium]|nr:hypothetical protein [Vicinamibacterales bacterium]
MNRTQPILLGGIAIGVLSALPIINVANCCCLWIAGGGMLTAYLVQQREATPLSVGDGALCGLLAGIVGAFAWAIVSAPIQLIVGPLQTRLLEGVLTQARDIPPGMRLWVDSIRMGALGVIQIAIGFFVMLMVGMVFSAIGGMLGVVLFRKPLPPSAPTSTPISETPPPA